MRSKKDERHPIEIELEDFIEQIDDALFSRYIRARIVGQIVWYDDKSKQSQLHYKRWSSLSLIAASAIPVFTVINAYLEIVGLFEVIIALFGAVTAFASANMSQKKHLDLWTRYRSNCENLKSLLYCYFTKSREFRMDDDEKRFMLLVELSEDYLTKEFQGWSLINMQTAEENQSESESSNRV